MGEVGAAIPEKQTESPAVVNGEVNGICKTAEPLEVDTEEDSQLSSENGITTHSEDNNPIQLKEANTASPVADGKEELDCMAEETSQEHSDVVSADILTNLKKVTQAEDNLKENYDSLSSIENEHSSVKEDDIEKDVPQSEGNIETLSEKFGKEESEESHDSTKTSEVRKDIKINAAEPLKNGTDVNMKDVSKVENSMQKSTEGVNNAEIIKPSTDNDEKSTDYPDLSRQDAANHFKITSVKENVSSMDVDEKLQESENISKVDIDDDDDTVVIHSDSESESEKEQKSSKDDDDDCVLIDDEDDKKDVDESKSLSLRGKSDGPQKEELLHVREISDDDDVQEIVEEDPLQVPPPKRMKINSTQSAVIPTAGPSLLGQITIKDPRTLMGPQNSVSQPLHGGAACQPINLVTNSSNASTVPVNIQPATGVSLPPGIRPGLSPISSIPAPKLAPLSTSPATTIANTQFSNAQLLPALTNDMFVLEAPSFIVPYIYEKPPPENLKNIVQKIGEELEKEKAEEDEHNSEGDNEENEGERSAKLEVAGKAVEEAGNESKNDDSQKRRCKKRKNPDDSWDELDTSTDEEASDPEGRTKVLIKEVKDDLNTLKTAINKPQAQPGTNNDAAEKKPSDNYFESPLGLFFIDIGVNLVQEFVQCDLLRQQKRKQAKIGAPSKEIEIAIKALRNNLETSRKRNAPFKFDMKRCEYCNFKTESALSMAQHYETPHMRNYNYKCNFCIFETRPAHDILFHMEAVHNIKGRLEKAPSYHQCPNCPFEDNGKSKLARHQPVCAKKFRPESNLTPPNDWEAPAKIPRIKPRHGLVGTATAYQAMAAQAAAQKAALASIASVRMSASSTNSNSPRSRAKNNTAPVRNPPVPAGIMRNPVPPAKPQMSNVVLPNLPNNFQIASGQLIQVAGPNLAVMPNQFGTISLQANNKKTGQQPSISITPLPRQTSNTSNISTIGGASASQKQQSAVKPGQNPAGGKASFVICEICDGYIKDLEQLRNHMQWMHKVKIHPKMIYNRPPLNCQKCQFRFFTDQGLERHLLGSHGLVTSSMQEAANKGKDAGRCPVCGRMYQWKLLNHVSRDHHMTLKPAHLSYKCTVCTATFGMYKQFENHVYTAHSTVAKKPNEAKRSGHSASGSNHQHLNKTNLSALSSGDSLLKPLKINDEITIIPQPASKSRANDFESHSIGKFSGR